MKIIKITTENEITTLEFPEGDITSVNKRLYEMIGPKCELMEHVMPSRLYKILGASNRPKKEKGNCTSILMDEEAYYHDLEEDENIVFSEELGKIVVGMRAMCSGDVPAILMSHYTVPGCNTESGQTHLLCQKGRSSRAILFHDGMEK